MTYAANRGKQSPWYAPDYFQFRYRARHAVPAMQPPPMRYALPGERPPSTRPAGVRDDVIDRFDAYAAKLRGKGGQTDA